MPELPAALLPARAAAHTAAVHFCCPCAKSKGLTSVFLHLYAGASWVLAGWCMQEAYLSLVDELRRGEESEDDEAVFARKNAKRLRKAEELLAPTLLQPLPAAAAARQQPQQQQPQGAPPLGSTSAHALLPAEAQHRYSQHVQQAAQLKRRGRQPQPQPQPPPPQQHAGWQPSAEGFKGVGGLDDAKRQLREMVLMPLTYPDLYKSLGTHPPR